jgi:hypothetical protein
MGMQPVAQALGKERIFNILNEIFRMSGAGYDLALELDEADEAQDINMENEQFISNLKQKMPQFEQMLQMVMQQAQGGGQPPMPGQPQQGQPMPPGQAAQAAGAPPPQAG